MPGIAGVVIGHNQHVAWGITLGFCDCEDVYLEKLSCHAFDGTTGVLLSEACDAYHYKGELLPLERREEIIHVKGGGQEKIVVRSTHHGPLLPMDTLVDIEHSALTGIAGVVIGHIHYTLYSYTIH
jgi:penicillin amidase